MELHISLGRTEHTATIYRQILAAVLDGRLRPGDRIPSSRALAGTLKVSRGTVTTAYERLNAEGFLRTTPGSGTFICDGTSGLAASSQARTGALRPIERWRSFQTPRSPALATYNFSIGLADSTLFPLAVWRRLIAAELQPSVVRANVYAGAGHPGLRAEIARYAGLSRSVVAGAGDVLLTTGAQQALDVITRVTLAEGDVIAIEEPGYLAARLLFDSHGVITAPVRVDAEGLVVGELPGSAHAVYVTPSHQFPLGMPMSLRRRTALL